VGIEGENIFKIFFLPKNTGHKKNLRNWQVYNVSRETLIEFPCQICWRFEGHEFV